MNTPICTTGPDGTIRYKLNGVLHRDGGSAYITSTGFRAWYQFGLWHRDDGPAVIDSYGTQVWCQQGERHRTDGPAVIRADGTEEYWLNGEKVDIMVHFIQRKD